MLHRVQQPRRRAALLERDDPRHDQLPGRTRRRGRRTPGGPPRRRALGRRALGGGELGGGSLDGVLGERSGLGLGLGRSWLGRRCGLRRLGRSRRLRLHRLRLRLRLDRGLLIRGRRGGLAGVQRLALGAQPVLGLLEVADHRARLGVEVLALAGALELLLGGVEARLRLLELGKPGRAGSRGAPRVGQVALGLQARRALAVELRAQLGDMTLQLGELCPQPVALPGQTGAHLVLQTTELALEALAQVRRGLQQVVDQRADLGLARRPLLDLRAQPVDLALGRLARLTLRRRPCLELRRRAREPLAQLADGALDRRRLLLEGMALRRELGAQRALRGRDPRPKLLAVALELGAQLRLDLEAPAPLVLDAPPQLGRFAVHVVGRLLGLAERRGPRRLGVARGGELGPRALERDPRPLQLGRAPLQLLAHRALATLELLDARTQPRRDGAQLVGLASARLSLGAHAGEIAA